MQLTKQTDFAFRTLIFLGGLPPGDRTHVQDVCDYHNISANHISKVVVKLAKLGYVDALRGKGGGIRLGLPPREINLATIVKHFESTLNPVNCNEPRCKIIHQCKLKSMLNTAMSAFLDSLNTYTLEDLLNTPNDSVTPETLHFKHE